MLSIVPFAGIYETFEEQFKKLNYIENVNGNTWLKNFFEKTMKLDNESLQDATIQRYWQMISMTKNGYVRNAVFAYGEAIQNFVERNSYCSQSDNCTIKMKISFTFPYCLWQLKIQEGSSLLLTHI